MGLAEYTANKITPQRLLIALGALCALFVSTFDSFRLSSGANNLNADFAAALLSPLYPLETGAIAQDGIGVLLLTDEAARRLGIDTPFLSYGLLARLVDALSQAKPAAIFLDFTFRRWKSDPQGLAEFSQAISNARLKGVPVLVGPISDEAEFAALRAAAEQVDVQWKSADPLEYPFDGERFAPFAAGPEAKTAAKRLYDIVCATEAGRTRYKCDLVGQSPKAPLVVEWARGAHPNLEDWWGDSVKSCGQKSEGVRAALAEFLAAFSRNLFHKLALNEGTGVDVCTYHLSGPVDTVLNPSVGRKAAEAISLRKADPAKPEAIEGRVVMIGSALGNDEFDAPGQGRAPGVFHHAMALDNMLSRGSEYRRTPGSINIGFAPDPEKRQVRLGVNNLIEIGLSVGLGIVISQLIRLRGNRTGKRAMNFIFSCIFFSLVLIVPILVAVLSQQLFHWTAANVFNIAAAALSVTLLLEWEHRGVTLKWSLAALFCVGAALAALAGAFVVSAGSAEHAFLISGFCLCVAIVCAFFIPSADVIADVKGRKQ